MRYLIIDGNNLGYKIYAAFSAGNNLRLTNSVGLPTTVIYGFLNSLASFAGEFRVDRTLVCWDVGGGSAYRKSIFPLYKGNREYKDMEDYFAELDAARTYMDALGIMQAPIKGIEADDVIGYTAKHLARQGHKVVIYSDDKDYYRLLSNKIQIYRPCKESMYTKEDFKKDFGQHWKPYYLNMLDALVGQEKDFIPGACDIDEENRKLIKFRFGPVKAMKLLEESRFSLKRARTILKDGKVLSEKHREQLLKNWKQVKLSKKLARIRTRPKDYNPKERKKLKEIEKLLSVQSQVRSKVVVKLMADLEIQSVDVIQILKSIGVKVMGKSKANVKRLKI